MKTKILFLIYATMILAMLSLILVTTVNAGSANLNGTNINPIKLCRVNVDIKEATETIKIEKNITVMENKTIKDRYPDYIKLGLAVKKYYQNLSEYNKLKDKSKAVKPVHPSYEYIYETKTIQVPKIQNIKTYFIDWLGLKIGEKTIQKPIYETISIEQNQIKIGYSFDDTDGTFYHMINCGGKQ
jgi:hypothetical protein